MNSIALCIDNNFVMQAATMLRSLSITNAFSQFDAYVLSETLTEDNQKLLLHDFENTNIHVRFIKIDIHALPSLPLEGKEHLSIATYYRLLLPFILPETVTEILYIDCDMLVLEDLSSLFETDFQGTCAASVLDMFDADSSINKRLEYNESCGYFNAGMIYINLPVWREKEISEKAFNFLENHPEKCLAHDQDALNHALDGDYIRLSATYNMQLDFFTEMKDVILHSESIPDIIKSLEAPAIVHFTGPTKPWKKNCDHPYMPLWDYFQNKTSWSDVKKTWEYNGMKLYKYFLKKFLIFIHLYKDRKPFIYPAYFNALQKLNELKGTTGK